MVHAPVHGCIVGSSTLPMAKGELINSHYLLHVNPIFCLIFLGIVACICYLSIRGVNFRLDSLTFYLYR